MKQHVRYMLLLFSLGICSVATPVWSADWVERPELATLFQDAEVEGTIALYDPQRQTLSGYNGARAVTRFVPASTFKIPHSLIALATGVVASTEEVLPYGGGPQPLPQWQADMSLREAIRVSNVPIYQGVARRIGLERMKAALQELRYGNATVGTTIDRFWLDGPLQVSAVEQVFFLQRLAEQRLPIKQSIQKQVAEILLLEPGLYGKTGWQNAMGPGVGWFVGWSQKGKNRYYFALNIDIKSEEDGPKRMEIVKSALSLLEHTTDP